MTPSKQQLMAGMQVLQAVAEAVREGGRITEGSLYAVLMGRMDLPAFDSMMGCLERAGLVKRHADHTAEWIGPR